MAQNFFKQGLFNWPYQYPEQHCQIKAAKKSTIGKSIVSDLIKPVPKLRKRRQDRNQQSAGSYPLPRSL